MRRKRRGIALLLAVGVLGLLVLIGISFATNMLLSRKEAMNFANSAKARYIAEGGIMRAIMDIRAQVSSSAYGNLKTYVVGYVAANGTNVTLGDGTYTLAITSEEDKVNLNTFDETDASQIAILQNFLSNQQIANIIDYRDADGANTTINGTIGNVEGTAQCKNRPFDSINEIRAATNINQTAFNNNRSKLTIYKPIIRGGLLGRYYRNIAGASPTVSIDKSSFRKKVVELGQVYQPFNDLPMPGTDGDGGDVWAETHDAEFAGGGSVDSPGDYGLTTFGVIWTGYLEILPAETGTPIDFWIACDDGARFYIIDGNTEQLVCSRWTDKLSTENYPWDRAANGTYTFPRAGWYKIRLEYYDQTFHNSVQLKWKNAAFAPATAIPADRLGYDPLTEVTGGYNHAGMYTISSTATATANGQVMATKQITATVEVFDTWTQTTKEEFYAAWFGESAYFVSGGGKDLDFRDGEVFNVNWLDSCPTDEDQWNAGTSRMHWEEGYATTPNSVKLGYWDDFDEDPAFSAVMMQGYRSNRSWEENRVLNISYQDFKDNDGDGDNELFLETQPFEADHFETNRYYFRPKTQSVFLRAFVKEPAPSTRVAWRGNGTVYPLSFPPPTTPLYSGSFRWVYYYDQNGDSVFNGNLPSHTGEPEVYPVYDASGNLTYIYNPDRISRWTLINPPAPGTYNYWQPEAPFCGCWLFAKANEDESIGAGPPTFLPIGFKAYGTDSHGTLPVNTEPKPLYPYGDTSEVKLNNSPPNPPFYIQFDYLADKAVAIIGWDNRSNSASYRGWINENQGGNGTWVPGTYPYPGGATGSTAIFKFVANNQYFGWDWADFNRGQCVIGPSDWDKGGAVTRMRTHWDDIRAIPENGFIVSTPFYASSNTIRWGTISWSGQTPSGTSVSMYYRTTSTGFPTADAAWVSAGSSGTAIGVTDTKIQYKAVLSTSNINKDQYSASSRTPVLEDITITYLPIVQVKYWREGS